MPLTAQAAGWLSLYVALVLLPAGVAVFADPFSAPRPAAVEFSVALGLLAYPLVLLQFVLVSRVRAASRPFGTDALVQFHQYAGFVCLALIVAHPLLLNATGLSWRSWNPAAGTPVARSGVVATAAIVLLVLTTVFRRRLNINYEWWQRAHRWLALVAAAAIVLHLLAANGYSRMLPVRMVVIGYAAVLGLIIVQYRAINPLRLRQKPWEIVANRDEGARTRTVRVSPVGHQGFSFDAGQFAWLITGGSPWSSQQHPLSIASSATPADSPGVIEFAIKGVGDWSSEVVPQLKAGTRVWVDGPFGAFTMERQPAPGFVLIAGGIGIAPFRSMLQTMRDKGDRRPVLLFYAAHDEARLAFRSELDVLATALNLSIVYVLEAPAQAHSGERGQISGELMKRHLPAGSHSWRFLVCGPPAMIDGVERALIDLGIPPSQVDAERFHVV